MPKEDRTMTYWRYVRERTAAYLSPEACQDPDGGAPLARRVAKIQANWQLEKAWSTDFEGAIIRRPGATFPYDNKNGPGARDRRKGLVTGN